MTVHEERERRLASWLVQKALAIEAERQQSVQRKKTPRVVMLERWEDIRASLDARDAQAERERLTKEINAKMWLGEQLMWGNIWLNFIKAMNESPDDPNTLLQYLILQELYRN
jgi:hypothetical protein